MYAAMRARFIRPPVTLGLRGTSKRGDALSALLNNANEKLVDLRNTDSRLYQPKSACAGCPRARRGRGAALGCADRRGLTSCVGCAGSVFAFEARGPVKFFSEGEITEGQSGDWVIVGEDGDVTVVPEAEFRRA